LNESFKKVSIDPVADLDDEPNYQKLTPSERIERLKNPVERPVSNPFSEVMDSLWSDYRLIRMQLLAGVLDHLMSDEDTALWNYIHTRKDLQIPTQNGYKLDREKIISEWEAIKAAFAKSKKGKAK